MEAFCAFQLQRDVDAKVRRRHGGVSPFKPRVGGGLLATKNTDICVVSTHKMHVITILVPSLGIRNAHFEGESVKNWIDARYPNEAEKNRFFIEHTLHHCIQFDELHSAFYIPELWTRFDGFAAAHMVRDVTEVYPNVTEEINLFPTDALSYGDSWVRYLLQCEIHCNCVLSTAFMVNMLVTVKQIKRDEELVGCFGYDFLVIRASSEDDLIRAQCRIWRTAYLSSCSDKRKHFINSKIIFH